MEHSLSTEAHPSQKEVVAKSTWQEKYWQGILVGLGIFLGAVWIFVLTRWVIKRISRKNRGIRHEETTSGTASAVFHVSTDGHWGVLLYPTWHAWQEEQKIHQIVQSFRNRTQESAPQKPQLASESTEVTETTTPYPELLEAMRAYNQDIWVDGQSGLCDPWSYQAPVFDLAEYGVRTAWWVF